MELFDGVTHAYAVLDLLAVRRGHFLFESGHHGDLWLDLELLCVRPKLLRPLAADLASRLAKLDIEVVCGPLVEDAYLGLLVASELNANFSYSERYAQRTQEDLFPAGYRIPPALRGVVKGKRVAIVNDVINAGSAVRGTFDDLQNCGATVFPANAALAASLGVEIRYYNLRSENGFRVELDELERLVDRNTRLLLVNSPHNPTGSALSDAEMQSVHDFCVGHRIQFVSDQVYHPIYHGPETRSAARLPHATVIGDFSKALCLSGLRVGWMIDHDPMRRERYRNARNYFTITANVFGEQLAVLALKQRQDIYARARRVANRNLALLDQLMAQHDGFLQWCRPRGGMTAFPWLADRNDTREFCRKLAKRGVLIVPGDCFGQPSYFRLGFAASGERFPLAMERFAEFLRLESQQRAPRQLLNR